jgi:outer membrane receptor for ferrienterochelin and colicin
MGKTMADKLSEKRVIPRPFAVTQDVFELEENTVTVTKHETALEDTAMAISVVTGDMVNEQGRSDILDVLKDTPGLTIDQSSQGKILIFAVSAAPSLLPKATVILMWR